MLQEQGSSSSRDGAMFGARLPMAFATVDVFDKVTALETRFYRAIFL